MAVDKKETIESFDDILEDLNNKEKTAKDAKADRHKTTREIFEHPNAHEAHGHGHDDDHKESVHGDCEEEAKNGGCCAKIGLFMCSFNDKYMKPFLIYKYTAEHQEVQDEFAELIQRD